MSSTSSSSNENTDSNLAILKKRSLDVKINLEGTNYKPIENIGIGAYGVVCSAIHQKTSDKVAIKKIPSVFDVKKITQRTYREIKILQHFKHDNVIRIRDILKPSESFENFQDIYVVFDLMESDLHKIIYSKQELTEDHVKYFLYQILRGLKYIHSANVVHRDLKPSNLLVNEDCHLRIGDFGMARGICHSADEVNHFMTQYVATRWYRAPELMLGLIEYGTAVDMWSVGCILAEMLGRKHIFPGKDYLSQIKLILGIMGSPSQAFMEQCQSPLIIRYIKGLGKKEPMDLRSFYPSASKKSLDLLRKMLVVHPKERIKVDESLKHLFLNQYHDPNDEPICSPTFDFSFEKEDLGIEQLRNGIYTEIMEYHQPKTPTHNLVLRPVPKDASSSESSLKSLIDPAVQNQIWEKKRAAMQLEQCKKTEAECDQLVPSIEVKSDLDKEFKISSSSSSQTSNLKTESDVEMLSAKATDCKDVVCSKPESKDKENNATKKDKDGAQSEKKPNDKQTISMDTKELIKQALLNSNLRKQRQASMCEEKDDNKPKPVTAAMRQREREVKRKLKKLKVKERNKKNKKAEKENEGELLTEADKELLQRWKIMQNAMPPSMIDKAGLDPIKGIPFINETNQTGAPQAKQETNVLQTKVSQESGQSELGAPASYNFNTNAPGCNSGVQLGNVSCSVNPNTSSAISSVSLSFPENNNNNNSSSGNQGIPSHTLQFDTPVPGFQGSDNMQDSVSTVPVLPFLSCQGAVNPCVSAQNQIPVIPSMNYPTIAPSQSTSQVLPQPGDNTTHQMEKSFPLPSGTDNNPFVGLDISSFGALNNFSNLPNTSQTVPKDTDLFQSSGLDNAFSMIPDKQQLQFLSEQSSQPSCSYLPDQSQFFGGYADQNNMASRKDQTLFSQTDPSASNDININITVSSDSSPEYLGKQNDPASDLITLLSQKFSKSQVEDGLPPQLCVTPKGTGAGYGVGMDIDSLILNAQETNSGRVTASPLSSSLLTDWMEVSGNLSLQDLEAIEQELQSPMALSYSDLNLDSH